MTDNALPSLASLVAAIQARVTGECSAKPGFHRPLLR